MKIYKSTAITERDPLLDYYGESSDAILVHAAELLENEFSEKTT